MMKKKKSEFDSNNFFFLCGNNFITIFPRVVPAGTINFRASDGANTI